MAVPDYITGDQPKGQTLNGCSGPQSWLATAGTAIPACVMVEPARVPASNRDAVAGSSVYGIAPAPDTPARAPGIAGQSTLGRAAGEPKAGFATQPASPSDVATQVTGALCTASLRCRRPLAEQSVPPALRQARRARPRVEEIAGILSIGPCWLRKRSSRMSSNPQGQPHPARCASGTAGEHTCQAAECLLDSCCVQVLRQRHCYHGTVRLRVFPNETR